MNDQQFILAEPASSLRSNVPLFSRSNSPIGTLRFGLIQALES